MSFFDKIFSSYSDDDDEDELDIDKSGIISALDEDSLDLLPEYFSRPPAETSYDQIDFSINILKATSTAVFHELAHTLKSGGCVAISLKEVPSEDRQRLTDCICGLIYAIDGHIEQEATKPDVLILTPKNIEITSGNYAKILKSIATL